MSRILFPALILAGAPAFAHDGPHFHPHGIEFGWLAAAAVGLAALGALAWFRGRK